MAIDCECGRPAHLQGHEFIDVELRGSYRASRDLSTPTASQRAALNDVTTTSYHPEHDAADAADHDDDDDDDCRANCCAVRLVVCCDNDNKQVFIMLLSALLGK